MASLAHRVLRNQNQMIHIVALYPAWSLELSSLVVVVVVVVMATETRRNVA